MIKRVIIAVALTVTAAQANDLDDLLQVAIFASGAEVPFDPSELGTVTMRFRADQGVTTPSGVLRWEATAGGYVAIRQAGTVTASNLNGKAAIHLSDAWLQITNAPPRELLTNALVIAIGQVDAGKRVVFLGHSAQLRPWIGWLDDISQVYAVHAEQGGNATNVTTLTSASVTASWQRGVTNRTTGITVHVNGVRRGLGAGVVAATWPATIDAIGRVGTAAANQSNGFIHEIIVVYLGREPTDEEMEQVYQYAIREWDI